MECDEMKNERLIKSDESQKNLISNKNWKTK